MLAPGVTAAAPASGKLPAGFLKTKPKLVLHSHRSYPIGHLATMFVLGLMGEYIGRLYSQAKQRPLYIIQEIEGASHAPAKALGIVASAEGPVAVKPEGHQRRQRNVGNDRPPRRPRKPLDQ